MSELLTLQDLANGHLDVKALGEAANGDENTIVTTRTGNTYPSAERAIKTMFQNGGLPAVPFATKALMTASSLANDKYAMVTDDTINNGLYVKTAGAWVKSAYDPVGQAKVHTDIKSFNLEQNVEVFPNTGWSNVLINRQGNEVAFAGYSSSDFIKVNKGDCFLVINKLPDVQNANTFSFYDNNKVFVGSIGQGRDTSATDSAKAEVRAGIYSAVNSFSNIAAIIPSDGYIRVSYLLNGGKTTLVKTNYDGLISHSLIQLPKESMKAFEGKFHSVIIEKSATMNGVNTSSAVVGNLINYGVAGISLSAKYPIKAGDYISVIGSKTDVASSSLFVEDAQGKFLGELEEYTSTSLASKKGGFAYVNRKSEFTGFLRIQHEGTSNVPCFISITDSPVSISENYLKTGQKIEFLSTGVSRLVNVFNSTALYGASWINYSAENNTETGLLSRSLPYLLKKGEVLEYGVKATIDPVMFITLPNKFTADRYIYSRDYFTPISATEILDLKDKGRALLAAENTNNAFIGDAAAGKAAYCNEHEDTVIIFLRPREGTTAYTDYKCNNQYEVNVYSKEQYIAKRNSELTDRLKVLSKYAASSTGGRLAAKYTNAFDMPYNQHSSFPPVLLFKGEILNCLTGSLTTVKTLRLRNPKVPSEMNELPINLGSAYLSSLDSGIAHLPIREDDKNSYNHTQVYARETCVAHVSFSALGKDNTTLLDVDGMIENSFFKPRIVHIDDAVVGENIMPTLIRARSAVIISSPTDSNKRELRFLNSSITDIYATFAAKGSYFEYSRIVIGKNDRAVLAPINNVGELAARGRPSEKLFDYLHTEEGVAKDSLDAYPATVAMTQTRMANQIPNDCLIYVNSNTRSRAIASYSAIETYDAEDVNYVEQEILEGQAGVVVSRKLAVKSFLFFVQNISEVVFNRNYVTTEDRHVHFPDSRGVYFNFCEPTSEDFDVEYYSILQVKRDDEVLKVLMAKTKNQGQSSATSARKSINLKCYNSKGERMTLKFDDHVPQETFTIKSYLSSDAGMFKDNLSADLWYEMRNADPYPIGGTLPPEVVADTNYPINALARGTTFGFPTEVHRGGGFFSLASLRNKKDEDNYGIQLDNPNHIMLQHEPNNRGFMVYGSLDLIDFEVRSPKMKGYEVSSLTLPPEYVGVQDNINRLLGWINGVYNGDIDLKTTYKDYIDLDSFLDYIISINVMSHWDSQRNNFILATHDAKIWRVYLYDADQSWGSTSTPVSPYQITLTQPTIFKFIFENMTDEVKRRYAKLRDKGIVNVRKQQADMQKYGSRIDPKTIELEAEIWRPIPAHSLVPYTMAWTNSRTRFLDIYYGYVDKSRGVVAQSLLSISSIAAGATAIVNYLNTAAAIGDVLSLETGANLTGIKAVITVETGGKIVLSLQNTTNATINGVSGYANIIKEIKYA